MKRMVQLLSLAASCALVARGVELNEVTPVEYIASSGSQYIDLGIVGGGDLEVETRMQWVSVPSDNCFIGARLGESGASADTRYFMINRSNNNGWYLGYKKYYGGQKGDGGLANTDYYITTVLLDGQQTMTVNGTQVVSQSIAGPFSTGYNLYLFGANYHGGLKLPVSAKCYYLKFYDRSNGGRELIADMIPCLDSQRRPGLYDKVRKQVFLGAGTGTLSYRKFIEHTAVKDYDVEYIESTGLEFVDTEIPMGLGYGATTDFSLEEIPTDGCMLGGISGGKRLYLAYYYNQTFCYGNGDLVQLNPTCPTAVGARNTVTTEIFKDKRICTVNGVPQTPVYTSEGSSWGEDCFMYVFALSNAGKAQNFVKAKCYGIKIWRTADGTIGGERTLVRDFRPCVTTDGNAALYDAVSEQVFENESGNGAFIAGPRIASGGVIVTGTSSDSIGTMSPASGRYSEGLEVGTSYTYSSERFFTDDLGNIYECSGYTTSTSTDGVSWGSESSVVAALSMDHVFDGSWWRITWQWNRVGRKLTAVVPDGASVVFSPANSAGMPSGYFYDGTEVTLTASEDDGGDRGFYCWYEIYDDDSHNEVFDLREYERSTMLTVDRLIKFTAVYVGPWVIDRVTNKKDGSETVVSNGNWTVTFKADANADGKLALYRIEKGVGRIDFTDLPRDTGIVADRSWDFSNTSGHNPTDYLTECIAPDLAYVGSLTFNNGHRLKNAVISDNVSHIGRSAFCHCSELSSLTPSISKIMGQVVFDGTELYAFYDTPMLTNDIVIARRDSFTLPPLYFAGNGASIVDFSGCRGVVSFDIVTADTPGFDSRSSVLGWSCALGGMKELVSCVMPPNMDSIACGIFFGDANISNNKQTEIRFTGTLPPPENVAYFYGALDAKVTLFIDTVLNPDAVTDFQLRGPTEDEIANSTFPKAAYDEGDFLGVWDKPTSGWGGGAQIFKRMWVVNWKSSIRKAKSTMILIY